MGAAAVEPITFSGLRSTPAIPRQGHDPAGKQFNADVYVFCPQTATDHFQYDVLDVHQWVFSVPPRALLAERDQGGISPGALESLTGRSTFEQLHPAVLRAAGRDQPTRLANP